MVGGFSMQQTARIMKLVPNAMLFTTTAGILLAVNPAACAVLRYGANELLGKSVNKLLPKGKSFETDWLPLFSAAEQFESVEVRLQTRKGQPLSLMLSGSVVWKASQQAEAFVFLLQETGRGKLTNEETRNARDEWYGTRLVSTNDLLLGLNERGVFIDFHRPDGIWLELFPEAHEVLGKKIGDVFPMPMAQQWDAALQQVAKHKQPLEFEYFMAAESNAYWLRVGLGVWIGDDGQFRGVTAVVTNITHYKQIEQRLQQKNEELAALNEQLVASEARFRSMADSAVDGILATDDKGSITFWNEAATHILGFTEEEVLGKPVWQLLPADYHSEFDYQGWMERGVAATGVIQDRDLHKKNGEPVSISISYFSWKTEDSVAFGAALRDITESKKLERALAESHHHLEMVVASSTAISMQNASLHQAAHQEIAHRRRAEITIQQRNRELDFLHRAGQCLNQSLKIDEVLHRAADEVRNFFNTTACSIWLIEANGGQLICQAISSPRDDAVRGWRIPLGQGVVGWTAEQGQSVLVSNAQNDGRFFNKVDEKTGLKTRSMLSVPLQINRFIIGVLQLIDEKTNHFQELDLQLIEQLATSVATAVENARLYELAEKEIAEQKRAQKMLLQSERFAATGKMAASVAHEIKNPLQSLLGCLGLAQEAVAENRSADKYFEVAYDAVRRISDTVTQMRELHRPMSEAAVPVDINELVEQVLILTQQKCANQQVVVTWEPGASLPILLLVADQLHQVFLNIVLNALEAMPQGGLLQVSSLFVEERKSVKIVFRDTGVGIASGGLEHIFEPFYTTKHHGSGIGLATSYRIVNQHRGWIEVSSQLDQGTTITVWLPI